jgi:hypothetical protein
MIRAALLRVGDACSRALPAEWGEAARAESREIESTVDLARWALGLVRLRLRPGLVLRRRRVRRR